GRCGRPSARPPEVEHQAPSVFLLSQSFSHGQRTRTTMRTFRGGEHEVPRYRQQRAAAERDDNARLGVMQQKQEDCNHRPARSQQKLPPAQVRIRRFPRRPGNVPVRANQPQAPRHPAPPPFPSAVDPAPLPRLTSGPTAKSSEHSRIAPDGGVMQLYTKILIGLVAGVVVGLVANIAGLVWLQDGLVALRPVGTAFIKLITMLVVPLVVASLLVGTASLGDIRKLGRIGGKTIAYYMVTTAVAVTIGLILSNIVRPGSRIDPATRDSLAAQFSGEAAGRVALAAESPGIVDVL